MNAMTTSGLLILDTFFVPKPRDGGEAYYEIAARAAAKVKGEPTVFLTRSPQFFTRATDHMGVGPVSVTWHQARRPNGKTCKVATDISKGAQS